MLQNALILIMYKSLLHKCVKAVWQWYAFD
jgi:hypothetical protein